MLGSGFSDSAHSDVARRTPDLATQPELGLLPERRTGLDSGYSGCPAFAGQNLSRMGANSGAVGHRHFMPSVLVENAPSFGWWRRI